MQRYLFESGPEGAAINTSNSGASLVSVSTGGIASLIYAGAAAQSGSFGMESIATNGTALARFKSDATSNVQALSVVFLAPDVTPAADLTVMTIRDAAAAVIGRLFWRTTGSVVFADKSGVFTAFAAAGKLVKGSKYRLEMLFSGGSETASTVKGTFYDPAGTTPIASINMTAANLTANPIDAFDFGNHGGISNAVAMGFDNLQIESARTTEIGAYAPGVNNPPTVSAGTNQTAAAGATVNLTGTASDADGAVASVAWTAVSWPGTTAPVITNASSLNASFPAALAGQAPYVFRLTATDNGGASSSSTVTVYVPDTSVTVIGVTDNSGAYTANPSTSTIAAVLADAVSSTYIESPASPVSPAVIKLRLGALKSVSPMTIALTDTLLVGTGNTTTQVQLLEGNTVRKTWNPTPTTTATEIDLVVEAASAATIGSFNALDLAISFQAA